MRCRPVAIVLSAAALSIGCARRAPVEEPEQQHVIRPGQEHILADILGTGEVLEGGCRFQGARIQFVSIAARYRCDAADGDTEVELCHPALAPAGALVTAKFALTVKGDRTPPPAGFPEALARRVSDREKRWHWTEIDDPTSAWEISAGMLAGPPLLGFLLGRVARRLVRGARRWRVVRAVTGAALLLLPIVVGPRLPRFSLYDLALVAILMVLGLLAGGRPLDAPRIHPAGPILAVLLSLGGLWGIEVYVRGHPVPIRDVEKPGSLHVVFDNDEREFGCRAFFPDQYDHDWFGDLGEPPFPPKRPGLRRVLHVGDSMTASLDVKRSARFPALLERARSDQEHLNLGVLNLGTDAELVIVRRWMDRLDADEIVLHVMPGNDIGDMDRPYACCDAGPLLDYPEGAPPVLRCPEPAYRFPLRTLAAQGPPPFPLRVAAAYSVLARRLRWGFQAAMPIVRSARDLPSQWEHFGRALAAIRDEAARRGIPLEVVVLPSRTALEGRDLARRPADRDTPDRMIQVSRALGIRTFDGWALFEDAMRRDPHARYFQPFPENPHFNEEGEALYAEWLAAQVWPR
jgi:hypothetical protein